MYFLQAVADLVLQGVTTAVCNLPIIFVYHICSKCAIIASNLPNLYNDSKYFKIILEEHLNTLRYKNYRFIKYNCFKKILFTQIGIQNRKTVQRHIFG